MKMESAVQNERHFFVCEKKQKHKSLEGKKSDTLRKSERR